MGSRQHDQGAAVVFWRGDIISFVSANNASMVNDLLLSAHCQPERFHHAPASGGPIARMNIDMPAPQADRTMIGVAIAKHLDVAVAAGEVFDGASEALGHSV